MSCGTAEGSLLNHFLKHIFGSNTLKFPPLPPFALNTLHTPPGFLSFGCHLSEKMSLIELWYSVIGCVSPLHTPPPSITCIFCKQTIH